LKRWHLTLVLALLAATGVALAGGVPAVTAAALVVKRASEPEPVPVEPVPVEPALPIHTEPEQEPPSTIPELEERLPPPPVVLPPDPLPPPRLDPCPACGMG
jgi:hypothetical protein